MSKLNKKVIGNLQLRPGLSKIKQSIYASQLYGTNFSIYGEFTVEDNGVLSGLKLFIINYKGILDIGMIDNDPKCVIEDIETDEGRVPICKIEVDVKAVVGEGTKYIIDADVTDSSMERLNTTVRQEGSPPQEPPVFFRVERNLQKMWANNKVFNNGVFDSEHFYRDGLHYEERGVLNVPEEYYGTNNNVVNPKIDFYQDPGWFCKTSTLKIVRS